MGTILWLAEFVPLDCRVFGRSGLVVWDAGVEWTFFAFGEAAAKEFGTFVVRAWMRIGGGARVRSGITPLAVITWAAMVLEVSFFNELGP